MADLLKVLVVLVLMVILLRKKLPIGLVMVAGALGLAIGYLMPPMRILEVAWQALWRYGTLNLLLSLTLVMALENVMRKTGLLRDLVESLPGLVGDSRLAMALLPALVGFLPSPGGAMFSAPMVQELAKGTSMNAEDKAFTNMWYRHGLEYVSPVSPALLLASQLVALPIGSLILAQLPLALVALVVGAPWAFWGAKSTGGQIDRSRATLLRFARGVAPIVVAVVLILGFGLDVFVALGIVVIALVLVRRYGLRQLGLLARESLSVTIVLLVCGVLFFKEMLIASGAITALPEYLTSVGFPPVLMMVCIAVLVGFLTGITQAPVATAFPLVLGIAAGASPALGLVALAYCAGVTGQMISPAHLCVVLTSRFFQADMGKVIGRILIPQMCVLAVGVVMYFLL